MSRYIDADYILDGIANDRALMGEGKMDNYKEHYLSFLEKCVEHTPSIDIVRCKECKHGTYCEEAEMYICNANDQDLYEAEHFCSYGEREGER